MKNNIFGYIFFIFIIGIMSFAIYKFNVQTKTKQAETSDTGNTGISINEKGTELTLGISNFDTINPIITTNKKVQNISKIIYESLVNITEDGKVESSLAKEWETSDNKTYIIRLKGGIKWSDGTYFSSSDVKYTIDKLKENKKSVYADNVKNITEVDIIDNTTLRVILSQEVPFFEYYLNFPILSSNYYGEDDFWNTEKNNAPITTGRFKISETTDGGIVLVKNGNWWNIQNDNSIIEKITINIYSSIAELYNAFKLGSIDIMTTNNANYEQYIGTIGYNSSQIEGRNYVFLAFNTSNKLLSDKNIRKAIKYGINKDEIISQIYNNSYSKANFPLNSNSFLVDDSNENSLNLDEMNNLIKNNGWNLKNGKWQKIVDYKTSKLEFNLVVNNDSNRTGVADFIKKSLEEQGFTINVIKASNSDYKKYLEKKNYDMILCEATQPIAPDLTTYFGSNNISNFSNNDVNEIMKYIDNISDENELKNKFKKLYEIYEDEVPFVGIARNKIYVITNSYMFGDIKSKWYNIFFGFKDWYTS